MRQASRATSKQSPGEDGGDHRHRGLAVAAEHRLQQVGLLGLGRQAVDGPPRWMSMMTSGSSVMTARPMASVLSAMPGPQVSVTARAPPKAAPIAAQMAAISSSAWNVVTPKFL